MVVKLRAKAKAAEGALQLLAAGAQLQQSSHRHIAGDTACSFQIKVLLTHICVSC